MSDEAEKLESQIHTLDDKMQSLREQKRELHKRLDEINIEAEKKRREGPTQVMMPEGIESQEVVSG